MAFVSAHIDDLLVVGSKQFIQEFRQDLSKELKLKIEGPLQPGDDGSIYYLKRELKFTAEGIDVSPSSRYIPKLAEMLNVADRRGKTVPHHECLQVHDPESTAPGEYLNAEEAKLFRSGLGVCIYVGQERCDVQHSVRVLATYMSKPTRTAMNALKKLTNYLVYSSDMHLHYPQVEMHQTTFRRWYGGTEKKETKPYMIELFGDSDWASCKVSRKSTSSGLIFLNSCLFTVIQGHRPQLL
eukprot:s676_g8.t1